MATNDTSNYTLRYNQISSQLEQALGTSWQSIPVGNVADGSITTAKLADGAVTPAKINQGAVDFTFPQAVISSSVKSATVAISRGADPVGSNYLAIGSNSSSSGAFCELAANINEQLLWLYQSGSSQVWAVGKNVDDTFIWYAPSGVGHTLILDPATGGLSMTKGSVATASSLLDMTSTTKGFLPPRMTTTQKNAIASPAEALMVYDLTLHKLCVYTGAGWETVASS